MSPARLLLATMAAVAWGCGPSPNTSTPTSLPAPTTVSITPAPGTAERPQPSAAVSAGPLSAPPVGFEIAYSTFGLMPAPRCGSPTYVMRIDAARQVSCGWTSACPPYSEAQPLRAKGRGKATVEAVASLAALAESSGFFELPAFDSNPDIIDGGAEVLRVLRAGSTKEVWLANTEAAPFSAVRAALEQTTGCSRADEPWTP